MNRSVALEARQVSLKFKLNHVQIKFDYISNSLN